MEKKKKMEKNNILTLVNKYLVIPIDTVNNQNKYRKNWTKYDNENPNGQRRFFFYSGQ